LGQNRLFDGVSGKKLVFSPAILCYHVR